MGGVDLPGCSNGDHCDNSYDKDHKHDSGAEAQILLQIVDIPICDLDRSGLVIRKERERVAVDGLDMTLKFTA